MISKRANAVPPGAALQDLSDLPGRSAEDVLRRLGLLGGLRWGLALVFGITVFLAPWLARSDSSVKSGVTPQSISFPPGPGSVEGLGDAFRPLTNSGTFHYEYPLSLPPMRQDASPKLVLEYDSGYGNGPLGMGWRLGLPSIRRQNDLGLPSYADQDTFLDWTGEELVRVSDGTYRAENEGAFTRYERTYEGGWQARLRDGSVLQLGSTPQSRQENTRGTYRWNVDAQQDPNGNRIEYRYLTNGHQIYPVEIQYGMHASEASSTILIRFDYETNRQDVLVDYRPGFRCETAWRLTTITVLTGDTRVRSWRLGYDTNAPVSLLQSITQYGDARAKLDENAVEGWDYLPPTYFDYTRGLWDTNRVYTNLFQSRLQLTITNWVVVTNVLGFPMDLVHGFGDFADLNQDTLPDLIFETDGEALSSSLNLGGSHGWTGPQLVRGGTPGLHSRLSEQTSRLVDLLGEGSVQFLTLDGKGSYHFRGFLTPTQLGEATPFEIPGTFPLNDPNVQLVDLNLDKAMDLMATDYGYVSYLVNRPDAGPNRKLVYGEGETLLPEEVEFVNYWVLADMNGDRLLDLVLPGPGWLGTEIAFNTGLGNFEQPIVMPGGPDSTPYGDLLETRLRLVDLNQDGYADYLLVDPYTPHEVVAWINEAGRGWRGPIQLNDERIPRVDPSATAVRVLDMNGSGSLDIALSDANDPVMHYLELNPGPKAWMLHRITNTLGGTLEVHYRSSTDSMLAAVGTTNAWTRSAPFSVPVVSTLVEGDGLGQFHTNLFSYRNSYYDGKRKQWRGFESVSQQAVGDDAQGAPDLVTRCTFDVGVTNGALQGKLLQTETWDPSRGLFWLETHHWTARVLGLTPYSGETRTNYFAHPVARHRHAFEKGPAEDSVQVSEEFLFDDFGNLLRHAEHGRLDVGDPPWDDERVTVRTYSANYSSGSSAWILDRVVTEEVGDLTGVTRGRKHFFYDDATFLGNNLGEVKRGNLTLVREWVDPSSADTETSSLYRASRRMEYDAYGNPTVAYDPLGGPGSLTQGHGRIWVYDARFHTHRIQETLYTGNPDAAAGGDFMPALVRSWAHDLAMGVAVRFVDWNGHESLFQYDPLGRCTLSVAPGDTIDLPTRKRGYALRQPYGEGHSLNWVEQQDRLNSGQAATLDSRLYVDGLGRERMRRTASEREGQVVVTNAIVYNQRGLPWKTYLPYFESGSLAYAPADTHQPSQDRHYDSLARLASLYQPARADGYRAFARITYAPLSQFVQDEEQTLADGAHAGAGLRYTYDGLSVEGGLGRLRSVEEWVKLDDTGQVASSFRSWVTRYRYDTLGWPTGHTDSQGNRQETRHDALGRLRQLSDPDRGDWRWDYDPADNLTNRVDGEGQQTLYTYDGVNRIQTQHSPGAHTPPPWRFDPKEPDVRYHYDLPVANLAVGDGTVTNTINTRGRLAWVADLSGEEYLSYDPRGGVNMAVKRVPDPYFLSATNRAYAPILVNYRTGWSYDGLGQLTRVMYPDGDEVTFVFNVRGLLQEVLGAVNGLTRLGRVVEESAYTAAGQVQDLTLGNGVLLHQDFDARARLSGQLARHVLTAKELMHQQYVWDEASHVVRVEDLRSTSILPDGDIRRNTRLLEYDDAYRLRRAQYSYAAPGLTLRDDGSVQYRHDRIGNLLEQTSTFDQTEKDLTVANLGKMSYGGQAGANDRVGRGPGDAPGPHALSTLQNPGAGTLELEYDDNGNLTLWNGMVNRWDPDSQLTSTRSASIQAESLYDYRGQRVLKWARSPSDAPTASSAVVYVNSWFEVRDHDQPVKYVWNGETRLAQVTGSLSTKARTQRIRIWPGWNLCAVAVEGAVIPLDVSLQLSGYRWNPAGLSWIPVQPNEPLRGGDVLWISSLGNTVLTFSGAYLDPQPATWAQGVNYAFAGGLQSITVKASGIDSISVFDPVRQEWVVDSSSSSLGGGRSFLLGPQEVAMIRVGPAPGTVTLPSPTRILYYHQNGESSVEALSDASGESVASIAYYPSGYVRLRSGIDNPYGFAGQETDPETGFALIAPRVYSSLLSRFVDADPVALGINGRSLVNPQSLNPYTWTQMPATSMNAARVRNFQALDAFLLGPKNRDVLP
jgi:RHS repeat-associated protein